MFKSICQALLFTVIVPVFLVSCFKYQVVKSSHKRDIAIVVENQGLSSSILNYLESVK